MASPSFHLHSWPMIFLALFCLLFRSLGLTTDGVLLLSLKKSVVHDPMKVLSSWNSHDQTPCSWKGVTCDSTSKANSRVTGLSLPNSELRGSIPSDLGTIKRLRNLNLSNNSINESIPLSLFNASELRTLDLSHNLISGELPELVGGMMNLELLNLSGNSLTGKIPENLNTLRNLNAVSLSNNYLAGGLPSGFGSVEIIDLSHNLINGSLPSNFSGRKLRYFNVSHNWLSGDIPLEFANQIPTNATIDLSFNSLSGEIPQTSPLLKQEAMSFYGNDKLCGPPLKTPCSSLSSTEPSHSKPKVSAPATFPPAIAAIPKVLNSSRAKSSSGKPNGSTRKGLRLGTIIGIVIGDAIGVVFIALALLFVVHHLKKLKSDRKITKSTPAKEAKEHDFSYWSSSSQKPRGIRALACLRKKSNGDEESSVTTNSDADEEDESCHDRVRTQEDHKGGSLVTVDREKKLELEALLMASAYILGTTGSSIMYKAVLQDGTAVAVRRIAESAVERFKDFEARVRVIAKLAHPNLVRIHGFYWGKEQKLVIYEFVPNGSLANARYRKFGSSPCHISWELRLRIAIGVAQGLAYIHEKKHVHGNLKPSNILLGPNMEPKIGDFGLERLMTGESGYRPGASARIFGSNRSAASRDSFQDAAASATPSPSPSSLGCISPYQAPESLRSLKPSPKWDVFSFGVVLLELLTGKVIVSDELNPGSGSGGLAPEENTRVLRMADGAIRPDLEGKEEALLGLLRLGFGCISPAPHKRPSMKEALQALEKFPSSSSSHYCGHQ
ncbi:Non-specific serine/threonine protein kinase [Bertholletia excelsa]